MKKFFAKHKDFITYVFIIMLLTRLLYLEDSTIIALAEIFGGVIITCINLILKGIDE